jgi:hypothetical protein
MQKIVTGKSNIKLQHPVAHVYALVHPIIMCRSSCCVVLYLSEPVSALVYPLVMCLLSGVLRVFITKEIGHTGRNM